MAWRCVEEGCGTFPFLGDYDEKQDEEGGEVEEDEDKDEDADEDECEDGKP